MATSAPVKPLPRCSRWGDKPLYGDPPSPADAAGSGCRPVKPYRTSCQTFLVRFVLTALFLSAKLSATILLEHRQGAV